MQFIFQTPPVVGLVEFEVQLVASARFDSASISVLRELYPNSFIFREPTFWFFGVLTASAMVVVGLVYGLVYVRHY